MPSTTVTILSEDQIDDLLYFARIGLLEDFQGCVVASAQDSNLSLVDTVNGAVEQQSGNSPLHMSSANGHIHILNYLCTILRSAPPDLRHTTLNLQNASGNTALHWASLNGQLEAVKILMAAGANPSVKNLAGHEAVYEAEINSKDAVVEWLLNEEKSFGSGVAVDEGSPAANDQSMDKTHDQDIDQSVEKLKIG